MLRGLAGMGVAAVGLSVITLVGFLFYGPALIPPTFVLSSLVAPALGSVAWMLAGHDLTLIRRGIMDPRGKVLTREAKRLGQLSVLLGAGSTVAWGLFLLALDL
jgi:hypothetical protein